MDDRGEVTGGLLDALAEQRRRLLLQRGWLDDARRSLAELDEQRRSGHLNGSAAGLIETIGARLELLDRAGLDAWEDRLRGWAGDIEALGVRLEQMVSLATLGELSASVAHEIRNPLCGILLSVEVLRTKMDADDSRLRLLENLHQEAEKMEKVVNNLLHFARHYKPRLAPCGVDAVIARSIELVRTHLRKKQIEVQVAAVPADCEAELDAGLVQQVFRNILLNGVDACRPGSRIEVIVEAQQDRGGVAVLFRDEGEGIPPDAIHRVFDPFFTSKHNGVGLGLAVSRKIVEAHGGRIEVESEPGRGACFTVVLPRQAAREPQEARAAA